MSRINELEDLEPYSVASGHPSHFHLFELFWIDTEDGSAGILSAFNMLDGANLLEAKYLRVPIDRLFDIVDGNCNVVNHAIVNLQQMSNDILLEGWKTLNWLSHGSYLCWYVQWGS